ncbi:ABC transporter B family member 15-like protein [Tanacetum coccineum]
MCTHCRTFGHSTLACKIRPRSGEEIAVKVVTDAAKASNLARSKVVRDNVIEDDFVIMGRKNKPVIQSNVIHKNVQNRRKQKGVMGGIKMVQNSKKNVQFIPKSSSYKKNGDTRLVANSGLVVWPKLKDEVVEFMKSRTYPSKTVRSSWSLSKLEYFYNISSKYGMEPYVDDDDNVEIENEDVVSETNGNASDMKPKFEIDDALNGGQKEFMEIIEIIQGNSGMSDFREYVADIEVEDIALTGLNFTWNKRPGKIGGLLKKLDRVLGNAHFFSTFPNSYATFLPFLKSDRTPVVLIIPEIHKAKTNPFKFCNYLAEKEGFYPIVKDVWKQKIEGYFMFSLVSKLKLLKKALRKLNFEQGNLFENVKCLRVMLGNIQTDMAVNPHNNDLREAELKCLKVYNSALKDEELFLKQKSKVEWLCECDRNSKHAWKTVYGNNIGEQLVDHFKNVLGRIVHVSPISNPVSLFERKLSCSKADYMVRSVSDEEIRVAMFDIDGNKAPGPDGFSSQFFKASWDIVGQDVCKAIKEFFHNGKLLNEVNSTIILLVPKTVTPRKVDDYRPIAWYFKGNRGLRQGNHMSPYLFTLIMEILTLMIRRQVEKSNGFKYHWQCKDLKLTNLCFVDDLILFCHCDCKSVSVLKKAMAEFSESFGLIPSYDKSVMFLGNVKEAAKVRILNLMPFREGKFPMKYLGVPLVSKRLYLKECQALVDKVRKKASVFILPVSIANDIERIMRDFLWNYGEFKRGKAKIRWESVCKPKVEGGLGIKSLESWNIALMTKHIWNIITQKESLWNAICFISDYISKRNIYSASLKLDCKVSDVIVDGKWYWPDELSKSFDGLSLIHPLVLDPEIKDKVFWRNRCGRNVCFSVSEVWNDIRDYGSLVDRQSID